MSGGIGGFYLASSLGFARQLTGSYQSASDLRRAWRWWPVRGALSAIKRRWRTTSTAMADAFRI